MFNAYEKVAFSKFYRHDGLLFRENKLCMPYSSLRELLVREVHGGGREGGVCQQSVVASYATKVMVKTIKKYKEIV